MIRKIFITLILILFTTTSFAAGSDPKPKKVKSEYDKAVESVKWAKKYEKKGKLEKAKKRYQKAQKLLLKSNKEKPLQADTLNYLGFTTRKLGDFENGEKYYLLGLEIDPNHVGINEYLGELYVVTNRLDLAKELSLIHISEPTRLRRISYAVFCLKKKKH